MSRERKDVVRSGQALREGVLGGFFERPVSRELEDIVRSVLALGNVFSGGLLQKRFSGGLFERPP